MFKNRIEAGELLATKLTKYKNNNGIVLAIPRGGVPVAYAVAKELDLPVDILLTKKIGHPFNREYAIGAASIHDYFVIPHEGVTDEYIKSELINIRKRLKVMDDKYYRGGEHVDLEGKTIIIIDDGIATGNTIFGIVHVIKKNKPKKIIIAVPISSRLAKLKLAKEVDEIIAYVTSDEFMGVGSYYQDFNQVTDDEVIFYLEKLKNRPKVA